MNEILQNLDWSVLTDMLLSVIPALICITLHELSHGYVALKLGDDTAKRLGRLTLNPFRHIDVMGLVMMALLHFGWAKPVPVDMRKFRHPKAGMALTALAGPVANVLIAVVSMFLYGVLHAYLSQGGIGSFFLKMLVLTANISISLAIFNMIPVPPLDGSKILFSLISDEAYYKLMRYERYGMILLVVVLLTGVLSTPLYKATGFCMGLLSYCAQFGNWVMKMILRGGAAA